MSHIRITIALSALLFLTALSSHVGSQEWQRSTDIDSTNVFSITELQATLFAITDNMVYHSTDDGETWQPRANQPHTTSPLSTLYSKSETLYVGTLGDGVFATRDQGTSWQHLNSGLMGWGSQIMALTILGDTLYAGTNGSGIYALNLNMSTNWTPMNNGLFQSGITSLFADQHDIYAGAGLYLFTKSRNSNQWTNVSLDSVGFQRQVFECFGLGPYIFVGTNQGIYRGTATDLHWQQTDISQFPNREIVALTAHGSRLYAGLLFGGQHWIFSSDDLGMTWEVRAHEFASLWDLFVSGDRLWAGRSDGLWYANLESGTSAKKGNKSYPEQFFLGQNYPNPFNAFTRISYSLDRAGYTELTLYDQRGVRVKTLVNAFHKPGIYVQDFDAGSLASGIYVYRLSQNGMMLSKRMTLIK